MCVPSTSLLVRLSHEDAARIRKEASSEHRSLSGYLLNVLERSFSIEQKVAHGASAPMLSMQARATLDAQFKKLHTAVHWRYLCSPSVPVSQKPSHCR